MRTGTQFRGVMAVAVAMAAALGCMLVLAPASSARMKSVKLEKNVCKTRGGGKFVRIPGSGGEKIDRRLLRDVKWMKRKFNIGIGDGFATSGHSPNGEHPIGAALDIWAGRNTTRGWNKIDRLARLAEPRQNDPILPWRWVGYDGDSGHGRGHHLHLSWAHSDNTTFGKPARWVLSRKCPRRSNPGPAGEDSGGVSTYSRSGDPLRNMAPIVPELHEH